MDVVGGMPWRCSMQTRLPVDHHYVQYSGELFDRAMNQSMIDLNSKVILEAQTQCAVDEMPFMDLDEKSFGRDMKKICETKLAENKGGLRISIFVYVYAHGLSTRYYTHSRYLP